MSLRTNLAISGFIDLLGFSQHLHLANYDTRTLIGETALKRLTVLEDVLNLIDEEERMHPQSYPEVKVNRTRFNDAIFFTMDLGHLMEVEIGEHLWKGYNGSTLIKWIQENHGTPLEELTNETRKQCNDVAKFVSLLARVHSTINKYEHDNHFPGARTIISTGLKVSDDEKPLDPFSANFALSNAYIVDSKGSKGGFGGNKFYLEDSAAHIIGAGSKHANSLYQSNIHSEIKYHDPYDLSIHEGENVDGTYIVYSKARIQQTEFFGKTFTFREVNPNPLTWIQWIHYIEEEIGLKEALKNDTVKKVFVSVGSRQPTIQELNESEEFNGHQITISGIMNIEDKIFERVAGISNEPKKIV